MEDFCSDLISSFESSRKKSKSKPAKKKQALQENSTKDQQPITQFFKEKKSSKDLKRTAVRAKENITPNKDSDVEELPENLSFLIDDILSHKMKRNLSLVDAKSKSEVLTSTPVANPRKKHVTPSKVAIANDSLEDSFDRMCNVRTNLNSALN